MNPPEQLPNKKWPKALIWLGIVVGAVGLALFLFTPIQNRIVIERVIKVRALSVCTELESAIQRFYDDNDALPIEVDADMTIDCNSAKGVELLHVLMNQEEGQSPRNKKGIKYLNIKQARGGPSDYSDGLVWEESGTKVIGLYDSWGGPYMIALDGNFDEEIMVQPKAQKEPRKLQRRVAVWSNGKDGVKKTGKAKDDVTTW